MSDLSVEIGKRIRNYRMGQKMSQEELAEKCGLHPTYIGQVERGEKNATLESISRITAGLSVTMSTLFEKIESAEKMGSTENYPFIAYDLVQALSEEKQEKLVSVMRCIIDMT